MEILKLFGHTIKSIDDSSGKLVSNINPTEIYNEGWLTRLLVYQSIKNGLIIDGLVDFKEIKNWTSEGLISSPFINVKKNREGYTHADMTLGDFTVDYKDRGEIGVDKNVKIFGIFEAKIGSNLSQGTTHAPDYNQASRNIACISHNVKSRDCKTFFAVAAPEEMIKDHDIQRQLDNSIYQIRSRYKLSEIDIDYDLIERAKRCNVQAVSYEKWIDLLPEPDRENTLNFYHKCLKWNKLERLIPRENQKP